MKSVTNIPPHGGQLNRIAEHFGVPVSGLLDFSANINPDGPPESVVQALREALNDPAVLSQYPDLEERQLRLSTSSYAGVPYGAIVVANGFVPLLDAVLRATSIRRCLLPVPAFGEYRGALERAGASVRTHLLDKNADFRYQPDNLLEALCIGQFDSILLANPQNPSGVLYERANLVTFIEGARKLNVLVLLDEAFIDYCPDDSMGREVERFPNLIIFRSVTKFHGIPGLRIAYLIADDTVSEEIRRNLSPWSITTLAAIAVRAALADTAYMGHTLRTNHERRERLVANLQALGLLTYPAAANFLLLRFTTSEEAQSCWERLILDHGIVLRNCSNFEGLDQNHLRCAVRSDQENSQLTEALSRLVDKISPNN
jgi:threonine-phosphate decarboxylase